MEKGSSIDWCSYVEEDSNVIGTLFIQLPSIFTGGMISVFDGDEEDDEEDEDFINTVDLSGDEFCCHFLAKYLDCQYEIAEITSGSRILLRYSLRYSKEGEKPSAMFLRNSIIPLESSLSLLPRPDRMILCPLSKEYSGAVMSRHGIKALLNDHRAKAESLKIAGKNWNVLIVNATNKYSTTSTVDLDWSGRSEISVSCIYDEQGRGRKNEYKWIEKILDFSPIAVDGESGSGMLLTASNQIPDNWGQRKSRKTLYHHDGYDSDSLYGYGYGGTSEYVSTYRATFLLAYDPNSVFELKCGEVTRYSSDIISRKDGVDAAVVDIVEKQEFALMARLLDVVEVKEELRLDSNQCSRLLQMTINSTAKNRDIASLANRTIGFLAVSAEPDDMLWNTIISAVKKLGWNCLGANISCLLLDDSRKKEARSTRSRIKLSVFLERTDFCLKLGALLAGEEANIDVTSFVHSCIDDLASTDNKTTSPYACPLVLKKIQVMVEDHGWKAMEEIIKHSLELIISNGPRTLYCLVDTGALIADLQKKFECKTTQDAMRVFAADFPNRAQDSTYNQLYQSLFQYGSNRLASWLDCIRIVILYGEQVKVNELGKKIISYQNIFSSLLEAAAEASVCADGDDQIYLLDMLNKLLVQQSIDSDVACGCRKSSCECKWKNDGSTDSTDDGVAVSVPPSMHIQMALKADPSLAHTKDKDGRFPIHYAAESGIYENVVCILEANPKACIVPDPDTGLYPFMLAANNDNTASAFELLLADPNLVLGGIPVDEEEGGKKRKRSPSM
jgi:hypothetical protein